MPIRRTSNKSSYDSGFYTPEFYSDVGSRQVATNPPAVADYYVDWVIQTYGFQVDIYPSWWAS